MDARGKDAQEKFPVVNARTAATLQKIIIGVRDDELAAEIFAEKTAAPIDDARAAVKKIRKRITKGAASIDIKAEIGQHLATLDQLYTQATQAADVKTALSVEKERGRTLSLYNQITQAETEKTDREKEEARAILQSAFADDEAPERLDDLARAVINRLIQAESQL